MTKCYRIGCFKEATQKYKEKKSLCWLDPVCDDHQFVDPVVQSHLDCLETKKEIARGIEEEALSNCCSAKIINEDICSDCKEHCSPDICDECGGKNGNHEDISTMEAVYPNEPHMADIGSRPCPNSLRDPDDYDDQEER